MAIHEIGKDACYSDTDSIKFIGEHDDYFSLVNKQTSEIMKDVCKRYNLDYKWFDDLGQFEPEYNGQRFQAKFLGAKRYITKVNGVYETTIAGLPKNALKGYIDRLKLQHDIYNYGVYPDMFSVFENKMFLNAEISLKNAHTYNDIPHENIIDGVKCQELSSVGIYPIDFTMKLSDFYLTLIQQELEERKNYETRIY